jgi:anti-sigma-K factor RskA
MSFQMKSLPDKNDDDVLAMEYALGVLEGAERAGFEARLSRELPLAARVRQWDEHFAGFAEEIAPVAASAQSFRKIEQRLFGVAEKPSGLAGLWNNLNLWRGLAVAGLAGLVVLGSWNLQRPNAQPDTVLVADVTAPDATLKLAAFYDEARGELRLNRVAGAPAQGRSLELWLIAGKDAPVSLGVLPTENSARIVVPVALRGKFSSGVLAISDEPIGGSVTGAPTGAVLATGNVTAI